VENTDIQIGWQTNKNELIEQCAQPVSIDQMPPRTELKSHL